ncbi:3-deoxy-D-manno-octulosonic acid transferase [Frigoriflavimonas asaccharolytica]|uniref:3-deoxy-D-manno-octulosonic acid transferase n=1 Tax=Frigoriflavimonas asaccharolytica TaxID=2735899 RepID=A0A8J8GBF3_9FLAO|nr:glycosyltransferase N-terminal domain-containing protein [Frigoriflavimonas asaccharolytica]NRS93447.1 3-deoxy-D-manno-octulosonic-acid transferase [Frigoriflavimonas asaccharolytica]
MKFLYNISIQLLIFGMKLGAIFNEKLKKGIAGRKKSLNIVQNAFSKKDKIIWMHAASLGEYEQGLPVLEKLKENFADHKILITFFSPSGYENVIHKKNIADAICYLPFDSKKKLQEFANQFQTEIFFTVKYEYWYNLLAILKKKGTKIYVISALFYPKQVFFKKYGSFFTAQLQQNVDWFFHQTKESCELAKSIGIEQSSVSGDTRFDRVKHFQARDNFVEFIKEFKQDKKLIVFGSSWEAEEKIADIVAKNSPETKIIIAVHDLKRIPNILKKFPEAVLYSQICENQSAIIHHQLLIIDSIGLLSKLYSYADLAVIGGGFHSAGLHNILEAATFGVPTIFGNKFKKNPEADGLILANGAKSFDNENDAAYFIVELFKDEKPELRKMSENARSFIDNQPNATEIILQKILS